MEETHNTVNNLVERIDSIKKEVDGLQVAVMKERSPWYKNIPTIISLVALLFSFGTTYVSYVRAKSQEIHGLRAELRSMLQRLAALPKENFDITKKYLDDPVGVQLLSSILNQENTVIVRQAADVIKRLPKEQVSSAEYYSIAVALFSSYNFDESVKFIKPAIETANDMNSEISALRAYANALFVTGQYESGRVEYQKALSIFSKYKGYNDYTQKITNLITELSWAFAEASSSFISSANQHIASAENIASSLPLGQGTEIYRKQIDQMKSQIASGVPSKIPTVSGIPVSPEIPASK